MGRDIRGFELHQVQGIDSKSFETFESFFNFRVYAVFSITHGGSIVLLFGLKTLLFKKNTIQWAFDKATRRAKGLSQMDTEE